MIPRRVAVILKPQRGEGSRAQYLLLACARTFDLSVPQYNIPMTDALLRYRSEFPILDRTTYLISNSLGAMPRGVYDAMHAYADTWATRGVRAWQERWWMLAAEVGDEIGAPHERPQSFRLHASECHHLPSRRRLLLRLLRQAQQSRLFRHELPLGHVFQNPMTDDVGINDFLLRLPEKSKQEATTAWQVVEVEAGGVHEGAVHRRLRRRASTAFLPAARTPRVASA